jgi:hypothetical protein
MVPDNHWVSVQTRKFQSLIERSITRTLIVEMALLEYGDQEKPIFSLANCPFLQAFLVYFLVDDNTWVKLSTYQNSWDFGLYLSAVADEVETIWKNEPESIYRHRKCTEFPTGRINNVSVELSQSGDIDQVMIEFESRKILLKAGEIREGVGGTIMVASNDESVLIFLDPADVDKALFDTWRLASANQREISDQSSRAESGSAL